MRKVATEAGGISCGRNPQGSSWSSSSGGVWDGNHVAVMEKQGRRGCGLVDMVGNTGKEPWGWKHECNTVRLKDLLPHCGSRGGYLHGQACMLRANSVASDCYWK